jgi:hypothetical protein
MPRYKRISCCLFSLETAKNWYGNISGKARDYWNSVKRKSTFYGRVENKFINLIINIGCK